MSKYVECTNCGHVFPTMYVDILDGTCPGCSSEELIPYYSEFDDDLEEEYLDPDDYGFKNES